MAIHYSVLQINISLLSIKGIEENDDYFQKLPRNLQVLTSNRLYGHCLLDTLGTSNTLFDRD